MNKEQQETAREIIGMILGELPFGKHNYTENILSIKDVDTLIQKIRSKYKLI